MSFKLDVLDLAINMFGWSRSVLGLFLFLHNDVKATWAH